MPTGGTWTVQNKVRAGAYINFVSVPKPVGSVSDRGIAAVCCDLNWGATNEAIKVTAADLVNGKAKRVIGYNGYDEESLPIRCAFSSAYTVYFLRRNGVGGTAAVANLQDDDDHTGTITANCVGTLGNKLSVEVTSNTVTGVYDVAIKLDGSTVEKHSISTFVEAKAIESDWVTVAGDDELALEEFEIDLAGGTNGNAVDASEFATLLAKLEHIKFNVFATQGNALYNDAIEAQFTIWREKRGKRAQAVIYEDYDAATVDREDIISVCQGFKTADETVTTDLFPIWVASQQAGAGINQSLTAQAVDDATEIIGHDFLEDEIEDYLNLGKFMLTYRQDGVVIIEKDINSLHTFTEAKNYAFSKNRVMRVLDQIGNDVTIIFNRNYCGKVDNNEAGRAVFKSEVIHLIDQMQDINAVQNFDGATDITVMAGEAVDSVVVDMEVQPVDSMEKLYMTVNVNA